MQHRAERPLRHLLFENPARVLIGIAAVNDERQSGNARRLDMQAEAVLLVGNGTFLVEIIEPRLTDRHHLGVRGAFDDLLQPNVALLRRIMRMRADRTAHIGKAFCNRLNPRELTHARRDGQHRANASRFRPRNDLIELALEIGKIQMAMAVDKHTGTHITQRRSSPAQYSAGTPLAKCPSAAPGCKRPAAPSRVKSCAPLKPS